MVHALSEIHRVLLPNGMLIDIRPISAKWPVEVVTRSGGRQVASLTDLPAGIADDLAADQAVIEAESRGWFKKEQEGRFAFHYYWDTPSELQEYLQTEWEDFERLDERSLEAVKTAWAVADGDARLRIPLEIQIVRWGKNVGLRKATHPL